DLASYACRDVVVEMEDGAGVRLDEGKEVVEDLAVRSGEVDVAAPDPVGFPVVAPRPQRGCLRIVGDDDVPITLQLLRVEIGVALVDLPVRFRQSPRIALNRVVEHLRAV